METRMKLDINKEEQQILIDAMMFYFTFYYYNTKGHTTDNLVDQYSVWYEKLTRQETKSIFEKVFHGT